MTTAAEIDQLWQQAQAAYERKDFQSAEKLWIQILGFLEPMLPSNPPEYPGEVLQETLAHAFFNRSVGRIETCGANINPAVHDLILATIHGNGYPPARQNILAAISMTRNYMQAKIVKLPDEGQFREIAKWHNEGFRILKTPVNNSPDRDWNGALICFQNVLQIDQNWVPTLHLVGMTFEGWADKLRKTDITDKRLADRIAEYETFAINSWIQVKAIDNNFDFEYRMKFEF